MKDALVPITYTAAGATVVSGLTLGEWFAAAGLVIAVATYITNFWFKWDQRKRDKK